MGTSITGIYRGKEQVNYLVFNFNVNVCLSLDVKIDDKFLEFYRSYCKDMYDSAMRNSNINDEYMSIAWKEICDSAVPVQDIAIVKEIKGRYFCFYYYDSTNGATYPTSIYEVYRNEEKDINDFNCWYPRVKGVNDGT